MVTRRVFLLSTIFLTLAAGMLVAINQFYPPLRVDPVPPGANVVPWLTPNPSLDTIASIPPPLLPWSIDTVMRGAMQLEITFRVALPNETRVIPSTFYFGHDSARLYVGGILRGLYWNPTSSGTITWTEYFRIYLDTDNDGLLTQPEAGSMLSFSNPCPYSATGCDSTGWGSSYVSFYHDTAWLSPVPGYTRAAWGFAQDYCNQPSAAGDRWASQYFSPNGTWEFAFSRLLSVPHSCLDGLQMRLGERWVVGFMIEVGYTNGNPRPPPVDPLQDFVDGWPRNAYPYLTNDASWFPKLAIDLTTTPANYT